MPLTEAQKRATAKYKEKNKPLRVCLEIFPNEKDITEKLKNLNEPKASYIKRLIREDIERNKE